jgi:hypothetical protein
VQPDNEDDAWRSIVENFGDRADLGPDAPSAPVPDGHDEDAGRDDEDWDDDVFVPPPAPPLPQVSPDRLVAWTGIFGAPVVLLTALVLGLPLPPWLGYLLVTWFVGGFGYLVVQMPRGPRDPGDDGARI